MRHTTPERFGDYELVERLGVGGMAETFVAIRRGESLDPGLTSYLAHALPSALDFAHTADEHGNAAEIKLADFGIAKATNLPGSIQSGALKGKIPYLN